MLAATPIGSSQAVRAASNSDPGGRPVRLGFCSLKSSLKSPEVGPLTKSSGDQWRNSPQVVRGMSDAGLCAGVCRISIGGFAPRRMAVAAGTADRIPPPGRPRLIDDRQTLSVSHRLTRSLTRGALDSVSHDGRARVRRLTLAHALCFDGMRGMRGTADIERGRGRGAPARAQAARTNDFRNLPKRKCKGSLNDGAQ